MIRLARRASLLVAFCLLCVVCILFGCATKPQTSAAVSTEPTDSRYSVRYNVYVEQVRKKIMEKWSYPCVKDETDHCDYKPAKLTVALGLQQDGRVAYVTVTQKAEWEVYEQYAVNALKLASPFPAVPAELMAWAKPGSDRLEIAINFHYVLSDDPRGPKGK